MHPGVVRLQLATPHEDHPLLLQFHPARLEALDLVEEQLRRQFDTTALGAQHLRDARLQWPQVDAVRVVDQRLETQPVGVSAEARAVRPGLQHQVQLTRRTATAAGAHESVDLVGIATVSRRALRADRCGDRLAHHHVVNHSCVDVRAESLEDRPELGEDLPLVGLTIGQREDGRAVVHDVAHTEPVERDVEVLLLHRAGWGQDDVGVARRLVQVDVHADHELQLRQCLVQLLRVRRRQHGVAGETDETAHRVLARGRDLLGEDRHRVLTHCLGLVADTAVPAADAETLSLAG